MNLLSLLHFQSKIIILLFRSLASPRSTPHEASGDRDVALCCVCRSVRHCSTVPSSPLPPCSCERERKKQKMIERRRLTICRTIPMQCDAAHLLSRARCTDDDDNYVNACIQNARRRGRGGGGEETLESTCCRFKNE